jgi:hypothetical protein
MKIMNVPFPHIDPEGYLTIKNSLTQAFPDGQRDDFMNDGE